MQSYQATFTIRRLWVILALVLISMFGLLLFYGGEIYPEKPPITAQIVSDSGELVFTREDIQNGQNIWQSLGGMQRGSIWGHGSYLAPYWSADWLHREATAMLEAMSKGDFGVTFDELSVSDAEVLKAKLRFSIRENRFNANRDILTLSSGRAGVRLPNVLIRLFPTPATGRTSPW
ncbi:MAG: hypothetical protein AB8C02_09975 [Halioglobus sp.]